MLVVSSVVIAAAFFLEVRADERVAMRAWNSFVLPTTCLTHSVWGVDCPGCGLTRSFVHLAHADWRQSLRVHRLGWLLAAAVVLQIPYRLICLRRDGRGLPASFNLWFGRALIFLLVANWLADLLKTQ